ncbi:hypothetical protein XO10_01455 [Marinitoga sp. 1135]|uniref:hypothetical protein n=1 Tax=Marinitoga sp. 1135 TaxID=1643333 RepID=UPI0015866546|nr:hypothetical protein [Marinitoga sp. 1135]NUU94984.1 hypothetical protein [Marinitoga sp. 1135]
MFKTFHERVFTIGEFAALYRNLTSFKKISPSRSFSIGILMLIYIFNKTLEGEKEVEVKSIIENMKNIDNKISEDLLKEIFERLIFENGFNGLSFQYYDYVEGIEKKIKYNFLDILPKRDISGIKTVVSLTKSGKDFMLKTLEVYKELQITMELLFLQEQFRKGTFINARNSAEKLKLVVSSELENIEKLIYEIRRAPWRVEFKKIEETYDFTLNQLQNEKQIFDRIFFLIDEYNLDTLSEEKAKNLNYIKKILLESREMHSRLLTKYQQITTEIMRAGEKNFWEHIINEINIEKKYLDKLFLYKELNPFSIYIFSSLKPKKSIAFNVFFNNSYEHNQKSSIILDENEVENIDEQKMIEEMQISFLKKLLKALKEVENKIYLSQIIEKPNKIILDTVLYMHQLKTINITREPLFKKALKDFNEIFEFKKIHIIPLEEEITIEDFTFTEYIFKKSR